MTDATRPTHRLVMVRHTAVDDAYQGRCYGATDVGLSPQGRRHADALVPTLAALKPFRVVHSGLQRASYLAVSVAAHVACPVDSDARLAELNFGAFEGQTWDALHDAGHDIARYIHEPNTFRADGGETTNELSQRVAEWYADVSTNPFDGHERTSRELPATLLVVAHGGPIAALRGFLANQPPQLWPLLIPRHGEHVYVPLG